jgi:hypothetical protein
MATDKWVELYDRFAEIVKEWESAQKAGHVALRQYWQRHGCVRCFHELHDDFWKPHWDYKKVKKGLDRFADPTTRRADRFYCKRHTIPLDCGIALYPGTLAGLVGHVGFAFSVPEVTWTSYPEFKEAHTDWIVYSFGLTSGPGVGPGEAERINTANPMVEFEGVGYTAWKLLKSKDGNFEEALLRSMSWEKANYAIIMQNCLDAAHDVLTAFGAEGLPLPRLHTPLSYFKQIMIADEIELHPPIPVPAPEPAPPPTPSKEGGKAGKKTFLGKIEKLYTQLADLGGEIKMSSYKVDNSQPASEQAKQLADELDRRFNTEDKKSILSMFDWWVTHAQLLHDIGDDHNKQVVITIEDIGTASGDVVRRKR